MERRGDDADSLGRPDSNPGDGHAKSTDSKAGLYNLSYQAGKPA